jgi:general stress protein YciG
MADTKHESSKGSDKHSESGRSAGGQHSGGNFKNDPERAAEAGHKGGQASGGNFKNDPQRASEAGQKGGHASHGGRGSSS